MTAVVLPPGATLTSKPPSFEVAVCATMSALTQATLSPRWDCDLGGHERHIPHGDLCHPALGPNVLGQGRRAQHERGGECVTRAMARRQVASGRCRHLSPCTSASALLLVAF